MRDVPYMLLILSHLEQVWEQYPHLSLGQLLNADAQHGVDDLELVNRLKKRFPDRGITPQGPVDAYSRARELTRQMERWRLAKRMRETLVSYVDRKIYEYFQSPLGHELEQLQVLLVEFITELDGGATWNEKEGI